MSEDELLVDVSDGIGTVTFHRPHVRNALTGSLVTAVRQALADLDADPDVAVLVLTGTDPAFCAGLDLKALAAGDPVLVGAATEPSSPPWTPTVKPVIGAVNGPCVAGGLEFALACDLLVASERATFADTHTRVGVMPGWELTVRLPMAVGRRLATWMSLTGTPLDAGTALRAGLVAEVVEHDRLLPRVREVAGEIAAVDQRAAQSLLASYRAVEREVMARGFEIETETGVAFREGHDMLAGVEARRAAVVARGSSRHASAREQA